MISHILRDEAGPYQVNMYLPLAPFLSLHVYSAIGDITMVNAAVLASWYSMAPGSWDWALHPWASIQDYQGTWEVASWRFPGRYRERRRQRDIEIFGREVPMP